MGACQCSKPKPPNHLGLDNAKQQGWETGHSSESGVEDNSLLYFLWTVEWSNTRQSGTSHQGLNLAVDTMGRCFDARLTILARERQSRMNFGKPSMRSTLPSGASTPQSSRRQERNGFYPRFWRMTSNSTKLKWRCLVQHSCEELANYSNILPSNNHTGGLDNNFRVICI